MVHLFHTYDDYVQCNGATANLSQTRPIVLWWAYSAPLVEIRLTVTQNLGKAWALEALVAVAPLMKIQSLWTFSRKGYW